MIPLKEHNNIVEALMKEINAKQSELKSLHKDKLKTTAQVPQLEPTPNELMLNKKITQLNKEFKERLGSLTQQLRSKSQENKDLKERLVTKANIQTKEKEHIAEILKKTYDRKPSSTADYKISALISHYDAELAKKNKFIDSLQKQMKQWEMNATTETPPEEDQNYKEASENEEKPKGVTLVEHNKQMGKIKTEAQKYRRLYEEKQKQYKDLSRRYNQLTNQYYKILNSYGLQQPTKVNPKLAQKTAIRSDPAIGKLKNPRQNRLKPNALQNLLHQMIATDSEIDENGDRDIKKSPAPSLESQMSQKSIKDNSVTEREEYAVAKLEQVLEFCKLNDQNDLLPYLCKTKTKLQEYELADTITRTLQTFFYSIGKGKISREELVTALQNLEFSHNRNLEAVDTLDEICIQVGAKRQKLIQKLSELLALKEQYYGQLKSLKFTQELAKGNKVVEFVDFFGLDKEEVALPQQLINLQEQLKTISKFVKEARIILDIEAQKSPEMVLQLILRYIEKTSSLVAKIQKKIHKPKPTPV